MIRGFLMLALGWISMLASVFGSVAAAQNRQPAIVESSISGNATVTISLPFSTNGLGVDHYQFSVVGNGYTWTLTNVASGQTSARNGQTIALNGQNISLNETTANLP